MNERSTTAARAGRLPLFRVLAVGLGLVLAVSAIGIGSIVAADVLVRTTETDTFEVDGTIEHLVVTVDGSVTVEAGTGDGAVVVRRSTFGLRRPRVTTTFEAGVLAVRVRCNGIAVCSNDVRIEVPASAAATIRAGEATVIGLDGDVRAENAGGSVRLTDVGGAVVVDVGGGEIVGTGLRSPTVRADAGAGAIDLNFAVPPESVEARVVAGAIVIELPPTETGYRVEVSSTKGDHRSAIESTPDSPRLVTAHAGAGDVEVRPTP